MEIDTWTMTDAGITGFGNQVKEALIEAMKADGVLPEGSTYKTAYVVVVHRRGMFGKALDALLLRDGQECRTTILRVK